jgi:hypothetical protein
MVGGERCGRTLTGTVEPLVWCTDGEDKLHLRVGVYQEPRSWECHTASDRCSTLRRILLTSLTGLKFAILHSQGIEHNKIRGRGPVPCLEP